MELINDPANLAIVHTGALGDHDNILSSPSGTWQPRWLYWSWRLMEVIKIFF